MIFTYQKLLQEKNISEGELPNDIKIGIKSIKGQERVINMKEKSGKNVADSQLEKIKREDKLVTREIQEWWEAKNKGTGTPPASTEEEEKKKKEAEAQAKAKLEAEEAAKKEAEAKAKKEKEDAIVELSKQKGAQVDTELAGLFKQNKTKLTLEELKTAAPVSYSIVFEAYEQGAENGLATSKFSLLETEPEKFTLTKN